MSSQNLPEFHTLVVTQCLFVSQEVTYLLADSLCRCSNLQMIDLSHIMYNQSTQYITLIMHGIGNCCNLRELYLQVNYFGDEGAVVLSSCLPNFHNLQELNLACNLIQEVGWFALTAKLHHCSKLKKLDTRGNDVTTYEANALSRVLPQSCALLLGKKFVCNCDLCKINKIPSHYVDALLSNSIHAQKPCKMVYTTS